MLLIFFELGVTVSIDISVMDHCYNIRGLIRVITNCRGHMLEKKRKAGQDTSMQQADNKFHRLTPQMKGVPVYKNSTRIRHSRMYQERFESPSHRM